MELLVLGGTSFAGRHVVERALAAGHSVTLFNRGETNPDLFPAARTLRGDRQTGDYETLKGAGPFHAVVDVCAYVPRAVREAVAALGPAGIAGPYVLISSVSAYAEPPAVDADGELARAGPARPAGFTEDSPLAALPAGVDPASEDVTGETYGALKVLTEEAAKALLPAGVMIIRPGLIVGRHDPTDRFTYWIRRVAEGGEILAPEGPDIAETQVVDAADLAAWIVASVSVGRIGTYNAVAPPAPLERVLNAARTAAGPDVAADTVWVPWEFLEAEGVQPWTDLPAWLPAPMARLLAADASKAAAAGLPSRPIEAVVADLAAWDATRPQAPLRAGLTREREAELLSRFRSGAPPPGP
jgi:2'-hydroxyisoflavone reductase